MFRRVKIDGLHKLGADTQRRQWRPLSLLNRKILTENPLKIVDGLGFCFSLKYISNNFGRFQEILGTY